MNLREAIIEDYPAMHRVRMSVKENILNNPSLVTEEDYISMVTQKGKGWIYEMDEVVVGFAIVDISTQNIWALFLLPEVEGKGIGKKLFHTLLYWAFQQKIDSLWLSTSPGTRAEYFYRQAGWKSTGITGTGEIRFELTKEEWFLQDASK